MQNAPPESITDAQCTIRISNSDMDVEVATDRHPVEPSSRENDSK